MDHAGPCPKMTSRGPADRSGSAPGRSVAVSTTEETEPLVAARVVTSRARVSLRLRRFHGTRGSFRWFLSGRAALGRQWTARRAGGRWRRERTMAGSHGRGLSREPAGSGRRRREGAGRRPDTRTLGPAPNRPSRPTGSRVLTDHLIVPFVPAPARSACDQQASASSASGTCKALYRIRRRPLGSEDTRLVHLHGDHLYGAMIGWSFTDRMSGSDVPVPPAE